VEDKLDEADDSGVLILDDVHIRPNVRNDVTRYVPSSQNSKPRVVELTEKET